MFCSGQIQTADLSRPEKRYVGLSRNIRLVALALLIRPGDTLTRILPTRQLLSRNI
jgi:hypothetical protein